MLNWFAKRLRYMQEVKRDERGFTLIELLVVVIIIGILAAIAIPVFLSQRENANQAACRSDVRNGAAAAQSYMAANDGDPSGMTAVILQGDPYDWNITTPPSSAPAVAVAADDTFTISVTCADAPAASYTFSSASGTVSP